MEKINQSRRIAMAEAQEAPGVSRRLSPLLGRSSGKTQRVHELSDGRIVLVANDAAHLVMVQAAADGEYALAGSGQVVVKGGLAVSVVGTPEAPALTDNFP
jgi:hypothetical protein